MRRFLPFTLPFILGVVLIALPACNRKNVAATEAATDPAPSVVTSNDAGAANAPDSVRSLSTPVPGYAAVSPAAPSTSARTTPAITLQPGTTVRVRLVEGLDTRRNRPGDRFGATLDEPLVSGDRVIVPKGTPFTGHVIEAKRSGRFKGHAVLALNLDSFQLNGQTYSVRTTSPARASRGHKKRNWLWIGGGSGGGAAIGAAAGGGAGALIGAGAGAAAGTVGAAITGRRDVRMPAESRVTFTLQSQVNIAS